MSYYDKLAETEDGVWQLWVLRDADWGPTMRDYRNPNYKYQHACNGKSQLSNPYSDGLFLETSICDFCGADFSDEFKTLIVLIAQG